MNKISCYGILGSNTDDAIDRFSKKYDLEFEKVFSENFNDFSQNLENTKLGVLPIENSTGGSVIGMYDLIQNNDFEILCEMDIKMVHSLLSKEKNLKDIKKVYSHYQALTQCKKFLDDNNIQNITFSDTATSSKYISKLNEKGLSAISNSKCANYFGLNIIKENICDNKNNTTRFLLVKKKNKVFDFEKKFEKNKICFIFDSKDESGSLYEILGIFKKYDINLEKIESRPQKNKVFSYYFITEFVGNLNDSNIKSALLEIKNFSKSIKILGNYEKHKY